MPGPDSQDGRSILDGQTTAANSTLRLDEDRRTIVELDPNHPGFRDEAYRNRRNAIAQLAMDYKPGTPIPDAPYVEEEQEAWRTILKHLEPALEAHACADYLHYSELLGLPKDRIPQLREVSARTQALTQFRLEPVGGLVHPRVFLSALGDGIFLSTQYIRHHSVPLYTPEPDVVHELVGHAAMLVSPTLTLLSRLVGQAARRAPDQEALDRLGRVYWFTLEFGVLREEGELKAYGAGLLSSAGELEAMHKAELLPFDPYKMEQTEYDVTMFQPQLFCADSFEHMAKRLGKYLRTWAG